MSEDKAKRNARMRAYKQRPEVKEKTNKQVKNRYNTDAAYRNKRKKVMRRWQSEHSSLGLGDPENIKAICKEFGFSDEVAEAIALDGDMLEKKLKEKKVEK
jgi:hypothetical protein